MTEKELLHKEAAMEAILFTMGNTVEIQVLKEALNACDEEFEEVVKELRIKYEKPESGVRLIRLDDAYQLCTKTEFYQDLITVATTPIRPNLTLVMLEVLSIIAYKQPVTKGEIERIRGVSCDYAINRLVEFGLIEEVGREEAPGRPILFATTEDFLRKFGISSVRELPPLSEEVMRKAAEDAFVNSNFTLNGQLSFTEVGEDGDLSITGGDLFGFSDGISSESCDSESRADFEGAETEDEP